MKKEQKLTIEVQDTLENRIALQEQMLKQMNALPGTLPRQTLTLTERMLDIKFITTVEFADGVGSITVDYVGYENE